MKTRLKIGLLSHPRRGSMACPDALLPLHPPQTRPARARIPSSRPRRSPVPAARFKNDLSSCAEAVPDPRRHDRSPPGDPLGSSRGKPPPGTGSKPSAPCPKPYTTAPFTLLLSILSDRPVYKQSGGVPELDESTPPARAGSSLRGLGARRALRVLETGREKGRRI
jgi:hypothetical protein